jgi:hypothetical protein
MKLKPTPFVVLLSIVTAIVFAMVLSLYLNIPHVDDLYNLVYEGSRPKKPEDTATFLFIFPMFLLVSCIFGWANIALKGTGATEVKLPSALFGTLVLLIFIVIALYRLRVVAKHYGLCQYPC